MNLCFPTTNNQGMESQVFEHFGSAPMFLLVDSQTGEIKEHANRDKEHTHGNCQPLRALAGLTVDGIVVGGIGKGALTGLNQAGFKVFQAYPGTIADNLAQMATAQLKELTLNDVCGGHAGPHGHGHGARHGFGSGHGPGCGC
ncbi:MAG: NifB/NifX family molybdenum-iron cluster-binding protein [Desulfuromonadales bacterium]|nr:NifB/NifX family molybdenum-iron cluster-binding protein [Desulfuromonadales bacterium]